MSKRMTDTDVWRKEWYLKLKPKQKLLWKYLCDNCDVTGVIDSGEALMSFSIGEQLDESDFLALESKIEKLSNGKMFIKTFAEFQYGHLSVKCPPHKNIICKLQKLSEECPEVLGYPYIVKAVALWQRYCKPRVDTGLEYPNVRVQEEEEDKEEEKDSSLKGENEGVMSENVQDDSVTPSNASVTPQMDEAYQAVIKSDTVLSRIDWQTWLILRQSFPKADFKAVVQDRIAAASNSQMQEKINPYTYLKNALSDSELALTGGGTTPKVKTEKKVQAPGDFRSDAVKNLVDDLERCGVDGEAFSRCLSAGADKYRDFGHNASGHSVCDEALDIIKLRRQLQKGGAA